jgi:glucosyl-dolichyl phosphate glucuronosyltransferase
MMHTTCDVSVVICTYTSERWESLVAAVESVRSQSSRPREILVVVDHNGPLLERVRSDLPDVVARANVGPRGLSGGRNTGIASASGGLIAFLDDDAVAAPEWLEWLSRWCEDDRVLGAGARVEPLWQTRSPRWFPEEFAWVLGCSYRGLPRRTAWVRNPFGGCMCGSTTLNREVAVSTAERPHIWRATGPLATRCCT